MGKSLLICRECQTVFQENREIYCCTCGGILLKKTPENRQEHDRIHPSNYTRCNLQGAPSKQKNHMEWGNWSSEEGVTPLDKLDSDNEHIYLKLEYKSPFKSYLGRGSALLVKKLKQQKITKIGLTAANYLNLSIARHAKLACIPCELYLPEDSSSFLINEFKNEGVCIHHSVHEQEALVNKHMFIATDNHPYLTEGAKTFANELWKQLGKSEPDIVVFSLESSLLILGAYYGFQELMEHNLIEKLPKFIIVDTIPSLNSRGVSISTSIEKEVKKIVKQTEGLVQTIPMSAVIQAEKALLIRGHQVDQQSAAAYAGCMRYYRDHSIKDETIVIPLSDMTDAIKDTEDKRGDGW